VPDRGRARLDVDARLDQFFVGLAVLSQLSE
jgi:hypothetical protein